MEETIKELIELLKSASPVIWQTLVRQAHNEAIILLVCSVAIVPIDLLFLIWSIKYTKEDPATQPKFVAGMWIAVSVLTALVVQLVISASMRFSNPEFYALKYILDALAQK